MRYKGPGSKGLGPFSFRAVVRKHRARQGLSQEALAEAAGILGQCFGFRDSDLPDSLKVAEPSRYGIMT